METLVMAVKVKLANGGWEHFDGEDDTFSERTDGSLEIHRGDGTSKVFRANTWQEVDGKKLPPSL
jgi:hypothetical protein